VHGVNFSKECLIKLCGVVIICFRQEKDFQNGGGGVRVEGGVLAYVSV
jgi:hypothetical protein